MANTEILQKILGNDLCAKWINLRDYAFDKLSANADIKEIMDEVDKYGYGEWVCEGQVPVMTSNTAPYGECIADSEYSGQNAWKAFDNNDTSYWASEKGANGWCGYHFINPVIVKRVMFYPMLVTGTLRVKNYKIQASNNGTTWIDLTDTLVADNKQKKQYINIDNNTSYSYYRMFIINSYGQDTLRLGSLQFYAYQPKGNVPIMTSNTAPYGEAIRSSVYSTSLEAYMAFDGISSNAWQSGNSSPCYLGYKFTNPVKVRRVKMYMRDNITIGQVSSAVIQGSNDGTTWVDLTESFSGTSSLIIGWNTIDITKNEDYYLYYRFYTTSYGGYVYIDSLQFYGREMKVSVPAMTSNTAPYGECETINNYSGYPAYAVFDGNDNSIWYGTGSGSVDNAWGQYKFNKKVCIRMLRVKYNFYLKNIRIQGSNNKIEWKTIYEDLSETKSNTTKIIMFDNDLEFTYYRMVFDQFGAGGSGSVPAIYSINFFGFDYSERDWDTEHPMKYLYDHGVELEEMAGAGIKNNNAYTNDGIAVDRYPDYAKTVLYSGQSAAHCRDFVNTTEIDLTDYTLLRAICDLSLFVNLDLSATTGNGKVGIDIYHDYSSQYFVIMSAQNNLLVGIYIIYTNPPRNMEVTELWLE